MAKTNIVVGLDVGSSKLTAVAAAHDFDTNTLQILTGRSVPCRGVRGGVVSDIRETSSAVAYLLGGLERELNKDISNLFVGVRGAHLESFSNHGTYNISRADKEITPADMELAIENAKSMPIKNDNEIVNVFTQGFAIDKLRGITNPEGMEGSLLEVDVHITTGSSTHLNNLAKAIQRPGYRIDNMFYGLVPLGNCVLTQEEKDIGAMIVDLGGETMSVGIYIDGILKFSRDIPYGCDLITSDLSRLLHTSRQNAKEIKEKYGIAFPTFLDEEGEIPVPSLDGRSTHPIKKSYILDIIQPRVEELFEQIQHCVATSGYKNMPVVGVLTGGGSQMPGMTDQAVNILGLKEVRRGVVQRDLVTSDDEFFDPMYSTAMSLAVYAAERNGYEEYSRETYDTSRSMFGKLGRFFKGFDLFGS
ncbi:MAG: cell division protein FtsA [Elusimicrobiaceae bacterium]|nr:cell division protein FtsA [Elusimicrobiaceae bacterium]